MRGADYAARDGLALAALVRGRQVEPLELVRAALEAVERVDPRLNAVCEAYADRAEPGGDEPDRDGRFAGVPFMLKDIGCTERGRRSEAGSRLLAGWVAPADTELMRRFRAAGLANVGRTATSEFAIAATVETAAHGVTRNPWDLGRSTAGSSGGAAAAVASGIVPIAHGSDGGGSLRMPASCCGVVGLKPSRGRVSSAPAAPPPGDLGVEFALTRSVRDAAALLDAVAGPAAGDPFRIAPPGGSFLNVTQRPSGRLRIGVLTEHLWGGAIHPEVLDAVVRTAQVCEDLGHDVVETAVPLDAEEFVRATLDLWAVGTARSVAWAAAQTGRAPGPDTLEGGTLAWAARGRALPATAIARALEVHNDVARAVAAAGEGIDVVLSATIPTLPLALGQYDHAAEVAGDWYYASSVGDLESTTSLWNCTGQPAISLPLHVSRAELPIGIQLGGGMGEEATLLALAAELEEACPWGQRTPPVHAGRP